jgi:hypothetical protein
MQTRTIQLRKNPAAAQAAAIDVAGWRNAPPPQRAASRFAVVAQNFASSVNICGFLRVAA